MYRRQASQVTKAETRVNITSIRLWRWYRRRRGSEEVGMMSPIIQAKHLSPWSQAARSRGERECMKTTPRTLSPAVSVSRLNYTGSAYYPPLNYSPPTAKIAPRCFAPLLPFPCVTRSSSQPHPRWLRDGRYPVLWKIYFTGPMLIRCGCRRNWTEIMREICTNGWKTFF